MSQLPLDQAIERFKQNEERVDDFANGADNAYVTPSTGVGNNYPTLPHLAKLVVQNGLMQATMYQTKSQLDAALSAAENMAYAVVTDDWAGGQPSQYNGFWQKQSGAWKFLAWNPINQLIEILNEKLLLLGDKYVYTVATETDRSVIPLSQRVDGMYVKVINPARLWQWLGGLWVDTGLSDFYQAREYTKQREMSNLLFDPFNETVNSLTKDDSLQSTQPAVFSVKLNSSVNSILGKPTLQGIDSQLVRRYFDVNKMALKGFNKINVKVRAYFSSITNETIGFFVRRSDNSVISSNIITIANAGIIDVLSGDLTVTNEAHHLLISVNGNNTKELIACAVSTNQDPKFIFGSIYPQFLINLNEKLLLLRDADLNPNNLFPDAFFRLHDNNIIDDYPLLNESSSIWNVIDYVDSPFATKRAIFNIAPAQSRNSNIKFKRLGLNVGDVVTIKALIVLVDGGSFNVSAYVRKQDNTVIGSIGSQVFNFNPNESKEVFYNITITQEMINDGEFIQFRLNVANTIFPSGWYILGFAIYINNLSKIRDTSYAQDKLRILIESNTPNLTKSYTNGEYYLRETRQRTRKLKLQESTQFLIASIGDSWTHSRERWSGTTAQTLIEEMGDAGGGWTGFGFHPTVTSLVNGNVRSTYTYDLAGTWASTYGTSVSPDICHITSSTAGDKITLTTPATPNVSACTLFYVATANGVVRYRFNGGFWTNVNVQGTVGSLGTIALTGFSAGTQTLEIEVVSGTCSLCGVNWKSMGNGIAWHKLGATGSRASQWAAVNATQWQTGIQALAPNLVTIMHGTNDQGANRTATQFATDISTIIDRIRAVLPLCDILVVMPCENGRTNNIPMSSYSAAVYDTCILKKVAFLDLQYVFGETFSEYASTSPRNWFNADLIHPQPETGGRAITDAVIRFLLN